MTVKTACIAILLVITLSPLAFAQNAKPLEEKDFQIGPFQIGGRLDMTQAANTLGQFKKKVSLMIMTAYIFEKGDVTCFIGTDGNSYIHTVTLTGSGIATSRGIRVGDAAASLTAKYGSPAYIDEGDPEDAEAYYIYESEKYGLSLTFGIDKSSKKILSVEAADMKD